MSAISLERRSELENLSPRSLLLEVTRSGEKFSKTEWVPLNRIVSEAAIVNDQHAEDLGRLLLGEWGQTQTVLLRCRVGGATSEDVIYDVLDGFHRVEGLRKITGDPNAQIKSEVLYNCTDAEMAEFRVGDRIFTFDYPAIMIYRLEDNTVHVEDIYITRIDAPVRSKLKQAVWKLAGAKEQLAELSELPQWVSATIFGHPVQAIDVSEANLRILVPRDSYIKFPFIQKFPLGREEIDQAIAEMVDRKLASMTGL